MLMRRALTIVAVLGLLAWNFPGLTTAQDSRPGLSGSWVGVYEAYPFFIRMTLNSGTGELRLEPLVQQQSIGRPPTGIVRVTVNYDAGARTLSLTPGPDAYRTLGVQIPQFFGVLDEEKQLIGGLLVGAPRDASPYFVMGRAEAADASFIKKLKDALQDTGAGGGTPRFQNPLGQFKNPLGGSGGQNKLREWASQLTKEYPDVDPYQTESGALFLMARNLFRDGYFRPHFGRTYDELGRGDFTRVTTDLRAIPPPRSNFPEERANGAAKAVERAFSMTVGTYTAPDIMLSVMAMRPMESWRTQALRRLQSAPTTADGLMSIADSQAAEQNALNTFWPSERRSFADAVTGARSRVAGPLLSGRVDELLASATSFAGAETISTILDSGRTRTSTAASSGAVGAGRGRGAGAVPTVRPAIVSRTTVDDSVAGLMALVSEEMRAAQVARLEARVSELLSAETQRDRDAIARLGDSLSGLESGSRLFFDLSQKYRSFSNQPSVRSVFDALAKQRSPLLRSAEAALAARFKSARSSSDLDSIQRTYLGVPSDGSDPTGGRLLQAAQQQRAQFQQAEAAEARRQEEERRRAASPCARASTDADDVGGPTEKELCLVLEELLDGQQAAVQDMQASCKNLGPNANPYSAFFCAAGTLASGYKTSMRSFRKIACSRAAPLPGFYCDYTSVLSMDLQNRPFIPPLPSGVGTARFVLSRGKWVMIP